MDAGAAAAAGAAAGAGGGEAAEDAADAAMTPRISCSLPAYRCMIEPTCGRRDGLVFR
jgi:hypothetical protein